MVAHLHVDIGIMHGGQQLACPLLNYLGVGIETIMTASVDQIISASLSGDRAGVEALLAKDAALASATTMLGSTAIHAAHYSGHTDVVRLLLTHRPLDGFLAAELGFVSDLA